MEFNNKKGWLVVALLAHTAIALFLVTIVSLEELAVHSFGIMLQDIATHIMVVSALLGITSLKIAIEIVRLLEVEAKVQIQQEKINNMEEFNLALREQRHDFLNHLQVVSGLIQIKSIDKAKDYLLSLSENLMVSDTKQISLDSEVGMLLYAKKIAAERNQISWEQRLEVHLESLTVPRLEMVRVLGNILDNALYELQRIEPEKRKLKLTAREQDGKAIISVTNYGTVINEEIIKFVCNPGFTTKNNDGDGMGLYIVKSLVERWGGKIDIIGSEEEKWTRVTITCPFNKEHHLNNILIAK